VVQLAAHLSREKSLPKRALRERRHFRNYWDSRKVHKQTVAYSKRGQALDEGFDGMLRIGGVVRGNLGSQPIDPEEEFYE
jgi:hypothetical protein